MLSQKNRLVKKTEFISVQRFGQRFFAEGLKISIIQNGKKISRAGFAIGTKFSRKAVERNRLKRILREIFRQEIPRIRPGADLVISAQKADGQKINRAALQKTVARLLQKSGLIS